MSTHDCTPKNTPIPIASVLHCYGVGLRGYTEFYLLTYLLTISLMINDMLFTDITTIIKAMMFTEISAMINAIFTDISAMIKVV